MDEIRTEVHTSDTLTPLRRDPMRPSRTDIVLLEFRKPFRDGNRLRSLLNDALNGLDAIGDEIAAAIGLR